MHPHIACVRATEVAASPVPAPWVLDPGFVAHEVGRVQPAVTFICSPNNPTGTAQPLGAVEAAPAAGPGLVLSDEAYGEVGRERGMQILGRRDPLRPGRSVSRLRP